MSDDEHIDRVLTEAATTGMVTEAVLQSIATALSVMLWTDFPTWRAWSDNRGQRSGPRTREQFRSHGQVLAMVAERLIK